jgi:hypothetical protein
MRVGRVAITLAAVCCSAYGETSAFVGGVPLTRLRGGGMPQFWVNQKTTDAKILVACAGEVDAASGPGKASLLTGKWSKVETVGQEKAMLMLGLNYVFRKAAILLSTVVINTDKEAFTVTTKGALVVSIKERYPFSGVVSECSRRDKRWGKHKGKIVKADDRKVVLDVTWDDPHGGHLTETFEVDKSGNQMTQTSEILVNKDATTDKKPETIYTYYSVYKRAD